MNFFFPSKFPICERVQLLGLEVYETDVSKIVSKFVLPLLYMLNCGAMVVQIFMIKILVRTFCLKC